MIEVEIYLNLLNQFTSRLEKDIKLLESWVLPDRPVHITLPQTVIWMREESEVFLDWAGLLGRPFSVGREPPCLLKIFPIIWRYLPERLSRSVRNKLHPSSLDYFYRVNAIENQYIWIILSRTWILQVTGTNSCRQVLQEESDESDLVQTLRGCCQIREGAE